MYCRYCGEPLKDNDRVCPSCGAPVEREDAKYEGANRSSKGYTYGGAEGVKSAPNNGPQTYYNGASEQNYNYSGGNYQYESSADSGSIGWGILGCCFPLIGLILFLVWNGSKPRSAKTAGIGAIVGVVLIALLYVAFAALGIGIGLLGMSSGEFDMSELEQYLNDSIDIFSNVKGLLF